MNHPASLPATDGFQLDAWRVTPESGEIQSADETIRIEPKVMDVLVHLAMNPRRVVSREELIDVVWRDVAVTDDSLTQAVIKLRRALGDTSRQPQYIETVPRRGYRLVVPVKPVFSGDVAPKEIVDAVHPTVELGRKARSMRFGYAMGGVLALAVAGFVAVAFAPSDTSSVAVVDPDDLSHGVVVAVLPFAGADARPGGAEFADGLADGLLGQLSREQSVDVVSRGASFAMARSTEDPREMARELSATHLLDGSMNIQENQIRLRVNLVEASTGRQLWGENYSGTMSQLFEFQDDVVVGVSSALSSPGKFGANVLRNRGTDNAAAYDSFVFGLSHLRRSTALAGMDPIDVATTAFKRSIELDPGFADAYAGLAWTEWIRTRYTFGSAFCGEVPHNAWASLETSLGLRDNALARRLTARRYMVLDPVASFDRPTDDHRAAITELRRSLDMAPNDPDGLVDLAHVLAYYGSLEEAGEYIERAKQFNPGHSSWYGVPAGIVAYLNGNYAKAIQELQPAYITDARQLPGYWYAASLARSGEKEAARLAFGVVIGAWDYDGNAYPGVTSAGTGAPNTIYSIRRAMPLKQSFHMDAFLDGLREFGVPEMPQPKT